MGLQITIFVSVFVFTSLVPHRKKNFRICSMVPATPWWFTTILTVYITAIMWVYMLCLLSGDHCLVKQNPAELPQHICQRPEADCGPTPQGLWLLHTVYQGPVTVLTVRYVVSVWLRPTRYSRIRSPYKWWLPIG